MVFFFRYSVRWWRLVCDQLVSLLQVNCSCRVECLFGFVVIIVFFIVSGLSVRLWVVWYWYMVFFGFSGWELILNLVGIVFVIFIVGSVGVSVMIDSDGIVCKQCGYSMLISFLVSFGRLLLIFLCK